MPCKLAHLTELIEPAESCLLIPVQKDATVTVYDAGFMLLEDAQPFAECEVLVLMNCISYAHSLQFAFLILPKTFTRR